MITRRIALGLVACGVLAPAGTAVLAGQNRQGFTRAAFEAAQEAGRSVLVEISASWCPTCKVHTAILDKLVKESKYSGITLFTVDFDSQKDVVRMLGARQQGTLIGFKGRKEIRRSVGETDPLALEDLLESTL